MYLVIHLHIGAYMWVLIYALSTVKSTPFNYIVRLIVWAIAWPIILYYKQKEEE